MMSEAGGDGRAPLEPSLLPPGPCDSDRGLGGRAGGRLGVAGRVPGQQHFATIPASALAVDTDVLLPIQILKLTVLLRHASASFCRPQQQAAAAACLQLPAGRNAAWRCQMEGRENSQVAMRQRLRPLTCCINC